MMASLSRNHKSKDATFGMDALGLALERISCESSKTMDSNEPSESGGTNQMY